MKGQLLVVAGVPQPLQGAATGKELKELYQAAAPSADHALGCNWERIESGLKRKGRGRFPRLIHAATGKELKEEEVEALRWAERNLWRGRSPALLAGEAEDPESGVRAWREGRGVAVWLEPDARRRLEERLAREGICSVEGYLALLSAQLGARVELAESDRWSPKADAALKELLEILRRLAGA